MQKTKAIKLLIVDDEPRARRRLAAIISASSLPIEISGIASNGSDGLAQAKSTLPDIIITDVRMPHLDGIGLAKEIRKLLPDCQLIFISGYSDKEYLKSAISLKAVSYVEKPFEAENIIQAIASAIDSIHKNRQRLSIIEQNRLLQSEQKTHFCEKAALEIISPVLSEEFLLKLGLFCPEFTEHPCYCTLICRTSCEDMTHKAKNIVYNHICNIVNTFFPAFLVGEKNAGVYIIHMCRTAQAFNDRIKNEVQHLYTEIKNALSEYAEIFISVGRPVAKPEKLFLSYLDAVLVLKKLFFAGYNHIEYYKEDDNITGLSFHLDSSLQSQFISCIKSNNYREARDLITKIFYDIRKSPYKYKINSIKNVYFQLSSSLNTICHERGIDDVFNLENDYLWENIAKKDTIFSLHNYLLDMITQFFEEITKKSGGSLLVNRIKQYIELHYHETELSINQMGDVLHFTPAYLCQIFKNETGTTINTYINTFRIRKACELLKERDRKLYEIAFCVGYSNQNYFSRQFKKIIGVTPSEFRDNYFL